MGTGESLLLDKCEVVSSRIVNLKIGGGRGPFFAPCIIPLKPRTVLFAIRQHRANNFSKKSTIVLTLIRLNLEPFFVYRETELCDRASE
jgi:hypothetical protein